MPSSYPSGLDNFKTDKTNTLGQIDDHPLHHNDLADAINKIEAELGASPSGDFDDLNARLATLGGSGSGIPASIGDVRGDTIAFSADNTPVKVPAGAAGRVLTSVGGFATAGVDWLDPAPPTTDWFNVRESPYNANNGGTIDAAPAIQAAIDDASAQGGGIVYIPFGVYRCNSTLVVPPNKAITIQGSGKHRLWAGQHSTKLLRVGVHQLLRCVGTGGTTSRCLLDLADIELHGNTDTTSSTNGMVEIGAASDLSWRRVNIVYTGGRGLHLADLWNCVFYDVTVRGCGNNTLNPAMMIWSTSPGPNNTDSAWFMACQWEANHGTEIWIDGAPGASASQQIHFIGGKIERSSGVGISAPCIWFRKTNYVSFQGFRIINQVGTGPHVRSDANNGRMRHFANCHFETGSIGSPPWSGPYFIDQQLGDIHLVNCGFFGASVPTTAYWYVGSGVGWAGAGASNLYFEGAAVTLIDQRSGPRRQDNFHRVIYNEITWDPPSVTPLVPVGVNVPMNEVRVGDRVDVGFSNMPSTTVFDHNIIITGKVVTEHEVLVLIHNLNASGNADIGSGTLRVSVTSSQP